jgi:putative oxidoreductase
MPAYDSSDLRRSEHGAFVLRVALGAMFIAHALLQLFVFTLPG